MVSDLAFTIILAAYVFLSAPALVLGVVDAALDGGPKVLRFACCMIISFVVAPAAIHLMIDDRVSSGPSPFILYGYCGAAAGAVTWLLIEWARSVELI